MEQFVDVLSEAGLKLAVLAVTVILALVYREARKYIQSQLGAENFAMLKRLTETIVRALEQEGVLPKWTGEQKKEMASNLIKQWCEKMKLDIDDDTIDLAIEEAVQVLNTEAGKFEYLELEAPEE